MLRARASYLLESRTKEFREPGCVVPLDGQAAASIGSLWGKGGYNDVSPDSQGSSNRVEVRLSISLVGQEVKHRPIVPHVDLAGQANIAGIRGEPGHLVRALSQARPSHIDGGLGDIHHDHIAAALIQQSVSKKKSSASDVDNSALP